MKTYIVQPGDTLSSIAGAFYDNAGLWKIIFDANRKILSNPNMIQVGQKLNIPPATTKPSADTTTTKTVSKDTLRLGSKGAPVTALQKSLIAINYQIQADGIFGPATDRSVRHVQKAHGLTADGLVGPRTRQLIADLVKGRTPTKPKAAPRSAASSTRPSNDTAALQRDLIALGFVIAITGYLDEETLGALHQFQENNGLDISDEFDSATTDALYEQTSALEDDEDFDEDEFDDEEGYFEDEEGDDEESDDEEGDDEESDDEESDDEESDDEEGDDEDAAEDEESEDEAEGESEDEAEGESEDEAEDEAEGESEDEAEDEATDEAADESDDGGGDDGGDDGGGDDGGGDDGGGDDGGGDDGGGDDGGDDGGGGGEDE